MSTETGNQLIAAERQRQIQAKGWDHAHDDQVGAEVLERAAWSYREAADEATPQPSHWPWSADRWNPKDRVENLVRAGALYSAAADTAERAHEYETRNQLRDHVASCALRIDSLAR